MECPKCHNIIDDNSTTCPHCKKVLLLECPNCHSIGDSAVCKNCGYTILIKCAKCSKINPAINDLCSKCGFPTAASLAYQECESDEFAYAIIKFNNLSLIRRALKSKDLYDKFLCKLRNLLMSYLKNTEGKIINYRGNVYAVNFNKELSFPTSANKAVRFAIKIANALTDLNLKMINEFRISLGLNIEILKKSSEDLQNLIHLENNIKLLNSQKLKYKYLSGTKIILDQYVRDEISKDYKTDSLYTMEEHGKTVMFYEVMLDSYILPPDKNREKEAAIVNPNSVEKVKTQDYSKPAESFRVFDINAKCTFKRTDAVSLINELKNINFKKEGKIIALRSLPEYRANINELENIYKNEGFKIIRVVCTEDLNYEPWGIFKEIFKSAFGISNLDNNIIPENIDKKHIQAFSSLFDLLSEKPIISSSHEDARYAYMERWNKFFTVLKNTVIIFEEFENLDDTSIQTIEVYFNKFRNISPNFVFITTDEIAVHSKIKGLLRTNHYTEFKLIPATFDSCLSTIKSDAGDFIESFYFDKIRENFKGSYLYFKNAINYLKETDILIEFENKLLIKNSKSVVIPSGLNDLLKEKIKFYDNNSDISLIFGYSYMLGAFLSYSAMKKLGIQNIEENTNTLVNAGLATKTSSGIIFNNYNTLHDIISESLKDESERYLAESILEKHSELINKSQYALICGKKSDFNQEYIKLVENSEFSLLVGDYDTYLKNCTGFLSLIENFGNDITIENKDEKIQEVYDNTVNFLYSYAPEKIYKIENILLLKAIKENDNDKIVRLSNLMLQGALLTSNYTDAQGFLFNILSRMPDASIIVDNAINTRFLLLSFVQTEVFYFTGELRQCVDTAMEIMSVIRPSNIEKIKPKNFSLELFVSHIYDTLRFAALAKLYLADDDMEDFFEKVKESTGENHPDMEAIIAIRDSLAGKIYQIGNIENYSPFTKTIFLILQELPYLKTNYKRFAQNIFQAKLLAEDIHQYELKLFCDILIAYAYSKIEDKEKSDKILNDVINTSEKNNLFNINIFSSYIMAKTEENVGNTENALLIINKMLTKMREKDNQSALLYAMTEQFYIDIAKEHEITSVNIESEEAKTDYLKNKLKAIID